MLKKNLNELKEIKKVEIKGKRLIESKKKLLSLFDNLLKTIFNKTVNESNSSAKNKTVDENESKSDNKGDYENDHESDNKINYESDYENDNQNINLTNKNYNQYIINKLNKWFETIDQTKSLEEQIEILKTKDSLYEYWYLKYYNDNKNIYYLELMFILLNIVWQ